MRFGLKGTATAKGPTVLAKHFVFGFLNCKTYTLVVLLLARGTKINATVRVPCVRLSKGDCRIVHFGARSAHVQTPLQARYHM